MLRRVVRAGVDLERLWVSPKEVLSEQVRQVDEVSKRIEQWKDSIGDCDLEARLAEKGIRVLLPDDDGFPPSLMELTDPPVALFAVGCAEEPCHPRVAVVGTRRASGYGLEASQWIAETLAKSGVSVISGLALGIDGAAHQGALNSGGSTVAVMACGPDKCYPPAHRNLWVNIQKQGVIYSEYAPGTPVAKYRFPERNRIIAALAEVIIVVQAGERSGALGTAECGLDLGRDIYVVPGPITSVHFRGAHRLLQDGARLLLDPNDVLVDLGLDQKQAKPAVVPKRLQSLYEALVDTVSAAELAMTLQCPVSHVYSGLLELELAGLVARVPGGVYQRIVK